jgi:hypothetical protein
MRALPTRIAVIPHYWRRLQVRALPATQATRIFNQTAPLAVAGKAVGL